MFWSIFLQTLAIILVIIVSGIVIAKLLDRRGGDS